MPSVGLSMNHVSIIVLLLAPLALVGAGGYALAAEEGLLLGILLGGAIIGLLLWFSDLIVVRLCRAEQLTVYHDPPLFRIIEGLSAKAGIAVPKVYSIPQEGLNALAIGLLPRNAAIIFTDGIRRQLPRPELQNVVAHEISHIKNRDTVVGCCAAVLSSLFGGASFLPEGEQQRTSAREATIMTLVLARASALVIRVLIDPQRELRADAHGAQLTGEPLVMANAVRTLEKKKYRIPVQVAPITAHLFMVNPLTNAKLGRIFLTHPPMEDRIARLESMQRGDQ